MSCKENSREPLKLLFCWQHPASHYQFVKMVTHVAFLHNAHYYKMAGMSLCEAHLFETNSHVKENSAALHSETCSASICFKSQPLRLDNRTKPFCYFVFILINSAALFSLGLLPSSKKYIYIFSFFYKSPPTNLVFQMTLKIHLTCP